MTYEENVRKVAEELGKEAYNTAYEYGCADDPEAQEWESEKEHWIEMHIPLARIAVRLQGEAYKTGYSIGRTMNIFDCAGLQTMLIDRGLIPAQDKCKHEHLVDIPRGKNGERYGPRCKDCGEFVQC